MADWTLNYADQETLRPQLVSRCKVAVRKFLLYTLGGGGSPSPARIAWSEENLANLDSLGAQMSNYMTTEPDFLQGGTSIGDAAIQSRCEFVLTTYFMPA